jgi:hypothetical protein
MIYVHVDTRQRAAELGLAGRPLTPAEWAKVTEGVPEFGPERTPPPEPSPETIETAAEAEGAQAAWDAASAELGRLVIEREQAMREQARQRGYDLVVLTVLPKFGDADPSSEDPVEAASAARDKASVRLSAARGRHGVLTKRDQDRALGLFVEG